MPCTLVGDVTHVVWIETLRSAPLFVDWLFVDWFRDANTSLDRTLIPSGNHTHAALRRPPSLALVPRKIGGKEAVATTRPHQSLFRDISHVTLPLSHPDVMSGLHDYTSQNAGPGLRRHSLRQRVMTGTGTDFVIARITGEGWMGKDTGGRDHPTKVEVAQRAYGLYEARGRIDGHDVEDWLAAEKELARHYAYSDAGASSPARLIDAVSTLRNASTLRS